MRDRKIIAALFAIAGLWLMEGCATRSSAPQFVIQTTEGPIDASRVGIMLPHEHIFTDLRGPGAPGYGQADTEEVVRVMKPLLLEARIAGVDLMVECTTIGVGRNVPVIARLARESGVHLVVPTGVYGRASFAPREYQDKSVESLEAWMTREITNGIEGTKVKAGFIKVASSETELRPLERKFLRAAAKSAIKTGVVIASHTTSGAVALKEVDVLREEGLPANRFIWVHAQAEKDVSIHESLAGKGVYIEIDSVGANPAEDDQLIALIRGLVLGGYADRILLSHDAGWYNPGQPNGGTQRGYTYLLKTFVPKLRVHGFDDAAIRKLLGENPRRAFSVRVDQSGKRL